MALGSENTSESQHNYDLAKTYTLPYNARSLVHHAITRSHPVLLNRNFSHRAIRRAASVYLQDMSNAQSLHPHSQHVSDTHYHLLTLFVSSSKRCDNVQIFSIVMKAKSMHVHLSINLYKLTAMVGCFILLGA